MFVSVNIIIILSVPITSYKKNVFYEVAILYEFEFKCLLKKRKKEKTTLANDQPYTKT